MRLSVISLTFLAFYSNSVGAGLYPTQPVANTVFQGGTWNDIIWKDSETKPSLSQLGPLRIDLWKGDSIHLKTVATNVNPMQMKQSVYIPSYLWENGPGFVLRFKSLDPDETIYTADFSMTNMTAPSNRITRLEEKFHQLPDNSTPPTSVVPSTAPSGGYKDMVTVTMEMSDSSIAPFPDATTTAGTVGAMKNDASNGGRHVRRPSMQFNFVFVLFPALFGLALAL